MAKNQTITGLVQKNFDWKAGDTGRRKQSIAERTKNIIVDKNPDYEITNLFRHFKKLQKPIDEGRLKFHVEAPGLQGRRYYFGFKYDFKK